MKENTAKKPVTMRLAPELLQTIENARHIASLPSRTAFVETACKAYAMYVRERL